MSTVPPVSRGAQRSAKAAKSAAVAKAKAVAPQVTAHIGSTPATKFRGNPDIFGRLVEDHDRHRALFAMIDATVGSSPERKKLFRELVREIKGHAAAEEQAYRSAAQSLRNMASLPAATTRKPSAAR